MFAHRTVCPSAGVAGSGVNTKLSCLIRNGAAPGPWGGADRRAVVRQLIERVVLTRPDAAEEIEVVIRWRGGAETRHKVYQSLRRYADLKGFEDKQPTEGNGEAK